LPNKKALPSYAVHTKAAAAAAAGFCILYEWLHLHNLRAAIADKVRRGPSHLASAFLIVVVVVVVVVGMRVITPQQQPVTCGCEETQECLKHARGATIKEK
jgi:hypothetical protein